MIFRTGLENNFEGRSLAWALGHPGCFAHGPDGEAALAALPTAIQDYVAWVATHAGESWLSPESIEIQLDETWDCYHVDEDYELAEDAYEVNAWFRHDWKPLTDQEIARGLEILSWSRADLLAAVDGVSAERLNQKHPGERWDIAGILKHVGGGEWWYLDRLGLAFPRDQVPEDPLARLETVRAHLVHMMPTLANAHQVVGVDGEFWSPRKMLRRAVWHERDHTTHIRRLLSESQNP